MKSVYLFILFVTLTHTVIAQQQAFHPNFFDYANISLLLDDGSTFVVNYSIGGGSHSAGFTTYKLDDAGEVVWKNDINYGANATIASLRQISNGNILVAYSSLGCYSQMLWSGFPVGVREYSPLDGSLVAESLLELEQLYGAELAGIGDEDLVPYGVEKK